MSLLFDRCAERIPNVPDKCLLDLVNGIEVSREVVSYRRRRSFLHRLVDGFGKSRKQELLLHGNLVEGQAALTGLVKEMASRSAVTQHALFYTQRRLVESREELLRLGDRVGSAEVRLDAVTIDVERLSEQLNQLSVVVGERLERLEQRVVRLEYWSTIDSVLAAWEAERTYAGLPWLLQLVLLAQHVWGNVRFDQLPESQHAEELLDLFADRVTKQLNFRQVPKQLGLPSLMRETLGSYAADDHSLAHWLLDHTDSQRAGDVPQPFQRWALLSHDLQEAGAHAEQEFDVAEIGWQLARVQMDAPQFPRQISRRKLVERISKEVADSRSLLRPIESIS